MSVSQADEYFRAAPKRGLYDPGQEHDACGVGFVANIWGEQSHELVHQGIAEP